jgi:hypothetical protein
MSRDAPAIRLRCAIAVALERYIRAGMLIGAIKG